MEDQIKKSLVSIIMPCYNAELYIQSAIKSVLDQSYSNWELLIVDDKSDDKTIEIVKKESDGRIKLITQSSRQGVIAARNVGIKEANGQFIAFLDSDDQWMPNKLTRQLFFMKENSVAFSYTSYTIIDSEDMIIGSLTAPPLIDYKMLLSKCDIGCSTVVYDTYIFGKQYFDIKSPRTGEDYILWLKIARNFPQIKIMGLTDPLMLYRKHAKGSSANKLKVGYNIWRVYRDFEHLNFFKASYYIIKYAFNGANKHFFK